MRRYKETKPETTDCDSCRGTGIGWGGPDSNCNPCRGSGYHVVELDPDDYIGPDTLDEYHGNR